MTSSALQLLLDRTRRARDHLAKISFRELGDAPDLQRFRHQTEGLILAALLDLEVVVDGLKAERTHQAWAAELDRLIPSDGEVQ